MTLQKGDRSEAVRTLQGQLANQGFQLTIDGWFGPKTEQAVIAFQKQNDLFAVGKVGHRTQTALVDKPDPKYLQLLDLTRASHLMGLPLAVIATIADVESSGLGLTESGLPVICFERHWFYRRLRVLGGISESELLSLTDRFPEIINPRRGGYRDGDAEFARFEQAAAIDRAAAIEATRWGMFQLGGLHWARMGFIDALDFQMAMQHSEGAHLNAFCKYILTDKVLDHTLRERNWRAFARRFNGPGFKELLMDVRLERALSKFDAIYPE